MLRSRRTFLRLPFILPALSSARAKAETKSSSPKLPVGCASGDVSRDGAVIWTRADQPVLLWVEVSPTLDWTKPHRFQGTVGLAEHDFNCHCVLTGLPSGQRWYYRVIAESLRVPGLMSRPLQGEFKTAPTTPRDIRFCWSGDTVGQGYGIDRSRGGMKIFRTMRNHNPDFFVHSGDAIYADNPLESEKALDDGTVWRNLMTAAKSKVAETTQDFRENYYYNYLDPHYRAFQAQVPSYQQWDDHEVRNDWYPGEQIKKDDRYQETSIALLAARAKQALFDCNPIRKNVEESGRLYRKIDYGPQAELFMLDLRSYRGPMSRNLQTKQGSETAYFGKAQLDWLKQELRRSRATWKIICADMPIGLIVRQWGTSLAENGANGDGPALGRELEIAELLAFINEHDIHNTLFITADVHYCGSYHYSPERAVFKNFKPFWEFVSGPLHAGTFGPNTLDNTFGPKEVFIGIPQDLKPNRPPSEGFQFFGQVDIDSKTEALTVSHYNVTDELLWKKTLQPEK